MWKSAACRCVLFLLVGCASTEAGPEPAPEERSQPMQVVPLEHAPAAELAAELGMLLKQARVVADSRTNSLIIWAETEAALEQVLELVEDLDVDPTAAD